METFRALVVDRAGEAEVALSVERWDLDKLLPGEVTIRVAYSSVNYKDGLAVDPNGRVARRYPLVPGIDLSGTVLQSEDPRHQPGDEVIVHGYDLGVSHHGGYAELARVPGDWVVPLPAGLTPRQAMAIGTAGFTAALSVERLEYLGLKPADGPVIVTGAAGGVGSTAVALLAGRGYRVVASTGSADAHDYLRGLGASEIVDRTETSAESERPMERTRWAGAVDAVGGPTLAYLIRTLNIGASVAASGNAGGATLNTTVFPFILRGVNLLGINSVEMSTERRSELWRRIAGDLRPPHLEESISRQVSLEQTPDELAKIRRGAGRGRVIVRLGE